MNKIHIKLEEGQKLFFTADHHLLHDNVLKFCARPFLDTKDMGEGLITNWNSVIQPKDIVFNAGDIAWKNNARYIREFYQRLNGTIYVLPGNHDSSTMLELLSRQTRITLCADIVHLWITFADSPTSYEVVVTHYPLFTWMGRARGSINIHGHIHSRPGARTDDIDLKYWQNQYDVGIDNNDYTPIEFRDIVAKIKHPKYTKLITNEEN